MAALRPSGPPEDPLAPLRAALLADPPVGLGELAPAELSDLERAVREAVDRQALALDAAVDRALGHLPWVIRGPVRRVIGL